MSPDFLRSAGVFSLSAVFLLTSPLAAAPPPAKDAPGAQSEAPATVAKATAGLEKRPGLLDFYVDARKGKVFLALPAASGPRGEMGSFIYAESLTSGLGSNPVGLDRGQLGDTRVITFRRVGGRVLVEQPNLKFRALSDNPQEQRAVRESFVTSVLWATEVAAQDADGRSLIDLTPFLVRDAHDIPTRMRMAGQGSWSLDPSRSVVDLENCLAFPDNLEMEALLTYQSADPGALVRSVTPTPAAVTLIQHHSLVRLPDGGYRPRRADPRSGADGVTFANYAAPLDQPIETTWAARYRLEKVDPTAERSRVKKPIVYYVDPGTPEPVRSALIEGAGWWKEAFEKAGFIDAYRVELLPPGAHPLDVRYNVVEWVHRSTRGWSYGGGMVDPRTGEILKGHVNLGSLRVRQDRLLFEGLAGTEKTGTGAPDDPVLLSLARIRQLAAHEVGHSLGFNHNFAASTYGRGSVMDYPAPLIGVTPQGDLDFSQAYARGMGAWDIGAVRYLYSQFPPGTSPADEDARLDAILREGIAQGLVYISDSDARPPGAAQPLANLWDNGKEPVEGLRTALQIRRIALDRFGEHNIRAGRPLAFLQEVLVPVYFHHRYQLDGAVKVVGGLDYTYAVRGDGQAPSKPADAAWQRRALGAVLDILDPAALDLPEPVIRLLLPRPNNLDRNVEMFAGGADPAFDPLAAAATAADMAVQGLLQPERAVRLVDFHRRDASLPGLEEVLDALVEKTFGGAGPKEERRAELRRVTQYVVTRRMIDLASLPNSPAAVRSRVDGRLEALRRRLTAGPKGPEGDADAVHRAFLAREISRYLERSEPAPVGRPAPPEPPPGQPIGSAEPGEMPLAGPAGEGLAGCSLDGAEGTHGYQGWAPPLSGTGR